MAAGSLKIGLWVSIGDEAPQEIGNVSVPLRLNKDSGGVLVADTREIFEVLKTVVDQTFRHDTKAKTTGGEG